MRLHDEDDDDDGNRRGGSGAEDSFDDDPDGADIADGDGAVKCAHCGRFIHGDAELCPYCKQWQTDDRGPSRKPLWFVVTVLFCVAAMSGALWIALALMYGWRP